MHLFSYLSILAKPRLNEMSLKPAHTVAELASARQHQQARPTIIERAVEGKAKGGGLVACRFFTVEAPAGAMGVGDPVAAERLALLRCQQNGKKSRNGDGRCRGGGMR